MARYVYPSKVKGWVSTTEYLPKTDTSPNEMQVFICYGNGEKALSDAGTVLRDAKKTKAISHWMPVYVASNMLPDPDSL